MFQSLSDSVGDIFYGKPFSIQKVNRFDDDKLQAYLRNMVIDFSLQIFAEVLRVIMPNPIAIKQRPSLLPNTLRNSSIVDVTLSQLPHTKDKLQKFVQIFLRNIGTMSEL